MPTSLDDYMTHQRLGMASGLSWSFLVSCFNVDSVALALHRAGFESFKVGGALESAPPPRRCGADRPALCPAYVSIYVIVHGQYSYLCQTRCIHISFDVCTRFS